MAEKKSVTTESTSKKEEAAAKPTSKNPELSKTTTKKSDLPTMKDLLEAGSHFGHPTQKWNPKMRRYIYDNRGGFHIIDLSKTIELLGKAVEFLQEASGRGDIVFVGTKRQAADIVRKEAIRAGAHFVVNRWIGGLLTNFDLIRKSFDQLGDLEKQLEEGVENRTKQEATWLKRDWARLSRLYAGVCTLKAKPAALVIVDPHFERAALKEAMIMGIPVVAIVDTNTDPDPVQYLVPGNDDALKSITLFMKIFADAVIAGNKGNGVKHDIKDFTDKEVEIKKTSKSLKADTKEKEDEKESDDEKEEVKKKPVAKKPVKKAIKKKSPAKKKTTKKKATKKTTKKTTRKSTKKKSK